MAAWEFQTLQNIAEKHGWHKFVSMQNYYNLLYREEGLPHFVFHRSPANSLSRTRNDPLLPRHRSRSHPMVPHRTRCTLPALQRALHHSREVRQNAQRYDSG